MLGKVRNIRFARSSGARLCDDRRAKDGARHRPRASRCDRRVRIGRLVPGPKFHQRMHPQVQMIHGHVGPDVAHLLLARAPDFLHVVKVLLDRGPVGEGFENLARRGRRVGAEEESQP